MDRTALDQALARRAEKKGAEYLLGTKAKGFSIDENSVQVEAEYNSKKFIIKGKILVLACGFGSSLTQRLGRIKEYIIGGQVEAEIVNIDEVEIYTGTEIAPSSFAWLGPSSQGKGFVGLLSPKPSFHLKSFPALLIKRRQDKIKFQGSFCSYSPSILASDLWGEGYSGGGGGRAGKTNHWRMDLLWAYCLKYRRRYYLSNPMCE